MLSKYSKETTLAFSLIGAGLGFMLADKYNKFGKYGTLGFMVGGLALGFVLSDVVTKGKTQSSETPKMEDMPSSPKEEKVSETNVSETNVEENS